MLILYNKKNLMENKVESETRKCNFWFEKKINDSMSAPRLKSATYGASNKGQ